MVHDSELRLWGGNKFFDMSKKRQSISSIDFQTGIGAIIPSTQEAFHRDFDGQERIKEKASLITFRETLGTKLDDDLKDSEHFPTSNEVFIFIVQYFASENEYNRRDIDNIAKTVLDVLKGKLYRDDSQVKTMLIGKKIEERIPQNFAYIAIKELFPGRDVDALKISGLERSVTMFQDLRKRHLV